MSSWKIANQDLYNTELSCKVHCTRQQPTVDSTVHVVCDRSGCTVCVCVKMAGSLFLHGGYNAIAVTYGRPLINPLLYQTTSSPKPDQAEVN